MSWVDLACLTVMLWGAVRGYLGGLWRALLHFTLTLFALPAAFSLHKPLLAFLNHQWHFETAFVAWYIRLGRIAPAWGGTGGKRPGLSEQAVHLAELFVPELAVLPVATQESFLVLLGTLLARMAAFCAFFLFFAVLIRYCLQLAGNAGTAKVKEWQRLGGMLLGLCHGFTLSVLAWLLFDAALAIFSPGALGADFRSSYLSAASSLLLRFFP